MSPAEVLEALVGLCREAGLEVRQLRRSPDAGGEPVARSGVCRVRGALWLVLSDTDGVEDRIGAAVDALRAHAPDLVEGRYLPPAVRERLAVGQEADSGESACAPRAAGERRRAPAGSASRGRRTRTPS